MKCLGIMKNQLVLHIVVGTDLGMPVKYPAANLKVGEADVVKEITVASLTHLQPFLANAI
jgi:hypothetical protein